jgi:hypothetical protein
MRFALVVPAGQMFCALTETQTYGTLMTKDTPVGDKAENQMNQRPPANRPAGQSSREIIGLLMLMLMLILATKLEVICSRGAIGKKGGAQPPPIVSQFIARSRGLIGFAGAYQIRTVSKTW